MQDSKTAHQKLQQSCQEKTVVVSSNLEHIVHEIKLQSLNLSDWATEILPAGSMNASRNISSNDTTHLADYGNINLRSFLTLFMQNSIAHKYCSIKNICHTVRTTLHTIHVS
jgi:hypothetical protein